MDKKAIADRYKKAFQIEVSVKPAEDEKNDSVMQQTSDLAPTVKDSDEPGVEKEDVVSEGPGGEIEQIDDMIEMQPKEAPLSKSLHARAREKMIAKRDALKKDLKV